MVDSPDAKITFTCDSCQSQFRAPAQLAGKTAKCPNCQSPLVIGPKPAKRIRTECPRCSHAFAASERKLLDDVCCPKCSCKFTLRQPVRANEQQQAMARQYMDAATAADSAPTARRRPLPAEALNTAGRGLHIAYLGSQTLVIAWLGLLVAVVGTLVIGMASTTSLDLMGRGVTTGSRVYGYYVLAGMVLVLGGIGKLVLDVADEYLWHYLGLVVLCFGLVISFIAGQFGVALVVTGLVHVASCAGIAALLVGATHCLAVPGIAQRVCAAGAIGGLFLSTIAYLAVLIHWIRLALAFMGMTSFGPHEMQGLTAIGESLSAWLWLSLLMLVIGAALMAVPIYRITLSLGDPAFRKETFAFLCFQGFLMAMLVAGGLMRLDNDLVGVTLTVLGYGFVVGDIVLLMVMLNHTRWAIR